MLAYRTTTGSAPTYFHSLMTIYIPSRSPSYFHSLMTIYIPSRSPSYFHSLMTIYIPSYFHSLMTIYIPSRSPSYFHSLMTIYIPSRSPSYFHSLMTIYIPSRSPAYFHSLLQSTSPPEAWDLRVSDASWCITERHKITFQNVFIHRSWLVEWSSHPHLERWVPVNLQATPENSSLPSSLDFLIFIIKENTPLLSFLNLSISS